MVPEPDVARDSEAGKPVLLCFRRHGAWLKLFRSLLCQGRPARDGDMLDGFQRSETKIGGCLRINPCVRRDGRGSFVKIVHPEESALPEDDFTSVEEFYSCSR